VRQRIHRVVAQSGDFTAAALGQREGLQHVVHLFLGEIQPRGFAGRQGTRALEEADPVLVQRHLSHRQIRGTSNGRAKKSRKEAHL